MFVCLPFLYLSLPNSWCFFNPFFFFCQVILVAPAAYLLIYFCFPAPLSSSSAFTKQTCVRVCVSVGKSRRRVALSLQ